MATNQITVSGEDQRRIGEFALLTQQIEEKNSRLVQLVNKVEGAKDALRGLEMTLDEDEPVFTRCGTGFAGISYGDALVKTQANIETYEKQIEELKALLKGDQDRSTILKRVLRSKFGDAIQLEY